MRINVVGTTFGDVLIKSDEFKIKMDNLSFLNDFNISAGGNGSNVALNLAKNFVEVQYFGLLGQDIIGELVLNEFQENGVKPMNNNLENVATGVSVVMVEESGEKALLSYQGANNILELDKEWSDEKQNHWILTGLGLLPRIEQHEALLKEFIKKNSKHLFIGVSANTAPVRRLIEENVMCGNYYFFMNRRESMDIGQGSDLETSVQFMLNHGIENIIVTDGKEGAYYFNKTGSWHYPPNMVEAKDSTGAGDAFMSGFIYAYLATNSVKQSMIMGNYFGSQVVKKIGGTL